MTSRKSRWLIPALAATLFFAPAVVAEEHEDDDKMAEDKVEHPAGYKKNFHIHSADGKFSMDLGARLQFRLTHESPDVGDSKTSFRVRRMKFYLSGHAYHTWLKYKLQANWAGSSVTLEDAYFDWAKNKGAVFRVGQYKAPYGIQELTSSGKQQFVDRGEVSEEFAPGRDIGVMLHGKVGGKKFGYALGVFNGAGRNQSRNDNDEMMFAGRIDIMPLGEYKYYESSTKNEDAKMLIGLDFFSNVETEDLDGDGIDDDTDITGLSADFSMRWKRLSFLVDYHTRTTDPNVVGFTETDANGINVQVGVFAIPKTLEFAARFGDVDPDDSVDNDEITETRFGVNYFIKDHKYKVQFDYGIIEENDVDDSEFRAQVQVLF